jgi:hypothetical protein
MTAGALIISYKRTLHFSRPLNTLSIVVTTYFLKKIENRVKQLPVIRKTYLLGRKGTLLEDSEGA